MAIWGFAFYRVPATDADWLVRAQAVCFGTDASGLPDGYGWAVLTLAPLSFVVAIFIALGSEIKNGISSIFNSKIGPIIIAVFGVVLIAEASWVTSQIQTGLSIRYADYGPDEAGALPENYPQTTTPAADFKLIDQDGETVSLEYFKGRVVIVAFAFAHCTTICPAIVQTVKNAADTFSELPVSLLLITLDPWRDTPSSLPSLAKRWKLGKNQHLLSGNIEAVEKTIADYNVATSRNEKDGDITHPAIVYILSPNGEISYTFNNPSIPWIRDGVSRLLERH